MTTTGAYGPKTSQEKSNMATTGAYGPKTSQEKSNMATTGAYGPKTSQKSKTSTTGAYGPKISLESGATFEKRGGSGAYSPKSGRKLSLKVTISSTPGDEADQPPRKIHKIDKHLLFRCQRRNHKACIVPYCPGSQIYKKKHVFMEHIPGIFTETLPVGVKPIMRCQVKALEQETSWLMGQLATLEELLHFVKMQKILGDSDNSEISSRQVETMRQFCGYMGVAVPDQFTLVPPNSVAVLIHWKVLLVICARLHKDEHDFWRDTFPFPEGYAAEQVAEEPMIPVAVDSHFHPDRLARKASLSAGCTFPEILNAGQVDPEQRVQVEGGVAVYCAPETYPTGSEIATFPRTITVTLGIHPRHASRSTHTIKEWLERLERLLLRSDRVVAVGEIGLDHSEPPLNWHLQMELLRLTIPLVKGNHVLVLHCRGMEDDCGTEAFMLLLNQLKSLPRTQGIHLHCFTGNAYVLSRWLERFPET
ncbi:hypothetical protein DPMN_008391 [Dreissena polymorpha]|uniref:Uncharacterized protein n=1 Tax=Dreissena polymorpha TaxID=45954 RepID=A0A9D4RZ76_DREPO|nr:hypothetical protein DPMN_008391 [Dreissena polymorpha]